jgi:two-component system sensor histidine kinase KdpD
VVQRVVEPFVNLAAVTLERHRLAQAEAQAKVLSEGDRLKTALLSMVSHDFRSPLTAIKAGVSSLLQGGSPWDAETQRELLQSIDCETDRLNHMVGNILSLSRLEAGAWRPNFEVVSIPELIGATLDKFSPEDNARIRVSVPHEVQEATLDSVQIMQVLQNLLENALKYSPAESDIELFAAQSEGRLIFQVRDRGAGIPAGEEEHIFQRFYRAKQWRESAQPGTGIGLAICRGLVEAHGGQIAAANRVGGGAVFSVTLPLHGLALQA